MGNIGRHTISQKVGSRHQITQEFVRRTKNFINNFEVTGGNMRFDGVRARLTVDGGKGGTSAPFSDHPFRVYRSDTTDPDVKKVSVTPGSFNGLVPTDIFDPITITGTGLEFVVVTLTVGGGSVPDPASASISPIESSQPDPGSTTAGGPPVTVKDVIAVLNDGVVSQVRSTNLTAISTEVTTTSIWNAATEAYDLTNYYRWEVGPS